MPLYFTEINTDYCSSPIEDRFYTHIHTKLVEGDHEVLDDRHVKPSVLLLALKSCTLLMSLVLLLLSGYYKTINSFTPDRDKDLFLREWEKNKWEGKKSCILQRLLTSKSQLYTTSAYFSIFNFSYGEFKYHVYGTINLR